MNPRIGVRGAGVAEADPSTGRVEDLDALLLSRLGTRPRKIGRFIRLALAGASDAVSDASTGPFPPHRTGVFLGTGLGNVSEILSFSEAVLSGEDLFPSPMQFANTVGNSAAFHIAQALGAIGPVLTLCQDDASFECAMATAIMLLRSEEIDLALVGGADVFEPPVEAHWARTGYSGDEASGLVPSEGSGWLLLERFSESCRAEVEFVSCAAAEDPAAAVRARVARSGPGAVVSLGTRLRRRFPDLARIEGAVGPAGASPRCQAFLTETAVEACRFLRGGSPGAERFLGASWTAAGCLGLLALHARGR